MVAATLESAEMNVAHALPTQTDRVFVLGEWAGGGPVGSGSGSGAKEGTYMNQRR
jgi:hypothetical protein